MSPSLSVRKARRENETAAPGSMERGLSCSGGVGACDRDSLCVLGSSLEEGFEGASGLIC